MDNVLPVDSDLFPNISTNISEPNQFVQPAWQIVLWATAYTVIVVTSVVEQRGGYVDHLGPQENEDSY